MPKTPSKIWYGLALIGLLPLLRTQAHARQDTQKAAKAAIKSFFNKGQAAVAGSRIGLVANLADSRINESSGLAVSGKTPGVFWTHNDSGDGPHLFAIDGKGRTLARYALPNAVNVDWEDMAAGPGKGGVASLYIGDIGDNAGHRSDTFVYRIPEPAVNTGKTMQELRTVPAERFPYRFPDGPHNAETLLVHPRTGEVFIVTKSPDGVSGVYAFPMPLQPEKQVTLQRVGTIPFTNQFLNGKGRLAEAERLATGGAISPDGKHIAIRTYLMGFEWDIALGQSVAAALAGTRRSLSLPLTQQGESLCYRADSKAIFLTSEKTPTPLYQVILR